MVFDDTNWECIINQYVNWIGLRSGAVVNYISLPRTFGVTCWYFPFRSMEGLPRGIWKVILISQSNSWATFIFLTVPVPLLLYAPLTAYYSSYFPTYQSLCLLWNYHKLFLLSQQVVATRNDSSIRSFLFSIPYIAAYPQKHSLYWW